MDDGSQLTARGRPDSSCEAINASASSATWYSIDCHHSEGIPHGYMVEYQRPGAQIGWRFGWRGTRQTDAAHHGSTTTGTSTEGLTSHERDDPQAAKDLGSNECLEVGMTGWMVLWAGSSNGEVPKCPGG